MRPADAATAHRPRPRRRPLALAAAALIAGLALAACGGGGASPNVANVTTTRTSTTHSSTPDTAGGGSGGGEPSSASPPTGAHSAFAIQTANPQKAVRFSECMRANGEPSFPDPNGQGVIRGSGIDPSSPAFQRAQKACAKDLGGGLAPTPAEQAKAQADALAYSMCMRAHGEPDFPDPTFGSGGQIRIRISLHGQGGSALDPSSPIFQKAQSTCQRLLNAGLPGLKAAT